MQCLPVAGSLVLGQDQECYGGCFSPQRALDGELANVRIWNRTLDQVKLLSRTQNCCIVNEQYVWCLPDKVLCR